MIIYLCVVSFFLLSLFFFFSVLGQERSRREETFRAATKNGRALKGLDLRQVSVVCSAMSHFKELSDLVDAAEASIERLKEQGMLLRDR